MLQIKCKNIKVHEYWVNNTFVWFLFLLKYYRENITLQIEIVQGEVDLELVKEREDALQQLEV